MPSQHAGGLAKRLASAKERLEKLGPAKPDPALESKNGALTFAIATAERCIENQALIPSIVQLVNESTIARRETMPDSIKAWPDPIRLETVYGLTVGIGVQGLQRERSFILLAYKDSELVACCSVTREAMETMSMGIGSLDKFAVKRSHEGTGVGSALMSEAEMLLAEYGCKHVHTTYLYKLEDEYSDRVRNWLEGKLAFKCHGTGPLGEGCVFRQAVREIPANVQEAGLRRHLEARIAELERDLSEAKAEADDTPLQSRDMFEAFMQAAQNGAGPDLVKVGGCVIQFKVIDALEEGEFVIDMKTLGSQAYFGVDPAADITYRAYDADLAAHWNKELDGALMFVTGKIQFHGKPEINKKLPTIFEEVREAVKNPRSSCQCPFM
eukprot:gnl/TRDRNA2_/TRDRNA2_58603_c0_seq1.p1 gnl/TRDRNA2_/TRDRNA2_58603_c0~~gnl/TRDRNA2_/TRDRNA2_58603_c0_seq1.p1  ORF type:complete len:383 (+),score=69.74 gnl/TRDRNA2_/TRDRNA2_58603_c0_seq1:40-1188(+)